MGKLKDGPPYGLKGQNADMFMWVQDGKALTPDCNSKEWSIWAHATADDEGEDGKHGSWKLDKTIKLTTPNTVGKRVQHQALQSATADDGDELVDEDSLYSTIKRFFTDAIGEVFAIFDTNSANKLDPGAKDCLISLSSNRLTLSWMDPMITKLCPFRKFLLGEFGTYQTAWTYMTCAISMPRSIARRNLTRMFFETWQEVERQEKEDQDRLDKAQGAQKIAAFAREWADTYKHLHGEDSKKIRLQKMREFRDLAAGAHEAVIAICRLFGWEHTKFAKGPISIESGPKAQKALGALARACESLSRRQGRVVEAANFELEVRVLTHTEEDEANPGNMLEYGPEFYRKNYRLSFKLLRDALGIDDVDGSEPNFFIKLAFKVTGWRNYGDNEEATDEMVQAVADATNCQESAVKITMQPSLLSRSIKVQCDINTRDPEFATDLFNGGKDFAEDIKTALKDVESVEWLPDEKDQDKEFENHDLIARLITYCKMLPLEEEKVHLDDEAHEDDEILREIAAIKSQKTARAGLNRGATKAVADDHSPKGLFRHIRNFTRGLTRAAVEKKEGETEEEGADIGEDEEDIDMNFDGLSLDKRVQKINKILLETEALDPLFKLAGCDAQGCGEPNFYNEVVDPKFAETFKQRREDK